MGLGRPRQPRAPAQRPRPALPAPALGRHHGVFTGEREVSEERSGLCISSKWGESSCTELTGNWGWEQGGCLEIPDSTLDSALTSCHFQNQQYLGEFCSLVLSAPKNLVAPESPCLSSGSIWAAYRHGF